VSASTSVRSAASGASIASGGFGSGVVRRPVTSPPATFGGGPAPASVGAGGAAATSHKHRDDDDELETELV
jgi:hypothetical protein